MALVQKVNVVESYTTSRTNSSYTVLYYGYLKTPSGFLKLGQLICCIVIVTLLTIGHTETYNLYLSKPSHLFFFTMAVAFLIITFCLLLSYILSLTTYHGWGQTSKFELIFNSVGFLLFLISTIIYLVDLNENDFSRSHYKMFAISGYSGCALTTLYLINAIMAR